MAAAFQPDFEDRRSELRDRAAAVAERYPLYPHLGAAAVA